MLDDWGDSFRLLRANYGPKPTTEEIVPVNRRDVLGNVLPDPGGGVLEIQRKTNPEAVVEDVQSHTPCRGSAHLAVDVDACRGSLGCLNHKPLGRRAS